MGFKHADMLTYVATGAQILAGVLLILGLFTPLAAAGALAYLVNGLLVGGHRGPRRGQAVGFPDRRTRVQSHPDRRGRRDHPDRPGPLRVGRRPRMGPPTVRRLLRRPAGRHRRRHRALGVPQRGQPAGVTAQPYGLGTRPALASVSSGSVANVTAGSSSSRPSLSCARAHEPCRSAALRCPPSGRSRC